MKVTELQASNPELYCTDKFSDHSYGPFYDELFRGKETAELNILEIGVYKGGSIRLWHDYLKYADITGVDVSDLTGETLVDCERVEVEFCDAYDPDNFHELYCRGDFDVIIDDGPHDLYSQIYALENFPSLLKSGGILIIEDVPEGAEFELIKHAPDIHGKFWIENLRHVKGRWDDCLVVFKKD